MNRLSYAEALVMAGGGAPRQPQTARDDAANAAAGTPNGGTPEDMATRLLQAAPHAMQSAQRGAVTSSVSDGGRRGMADPRHAQPPVGAPSDARQQGDPLAQVHAQFIQEMGPEAGEEAFRLYLAHQG